MAQRRADLRVAGQLVGQVDAQLRQPGLRVIDACRAEPAEEVDHVGVVSQADRTEAADAGCLRALDELVQEDGADALALPGIDDGNRNLGALGVLQPHIACDANGLRAVRAERYERLVILVVHPGEVVELTTTKPLDRVQKAPIARLVAQLLETLFQQRAVLGHDRPDVDD